MIRVRVRVRVSDFGRVKVYLNNKIVFFKIKIIF